MRLNPLTASYALVFGISLAIGAKVKPVAYAEVAPARIVKIEPVPELYQVAWHDAFNDVQAACAVAMVHGEARGESAAGQRAVIETALNRVDSKYYPDSLCEVIFDSHQFSFLDDINRDKTFSAIALNTPDIRHIRENIVIPAINRPRSERIAQGLHYAAIGSSPYWRASMPAENRMTIDGHEFFASKRP